MTRCPICRCPAGAHQSRVEGDVLVRVLCDGTKIVEVERAK
jgi:hypothetical protein